LENDCEILIVATANSSIGGSVCWNDDFKSFLDDIMLQHDRFTEGFLMGWNTKMMPNKVVVGLLTCPTNKLPSLNKLGKYGCIQVKKLVAEYAGIRYGQRLTNAQRALKVINVLQVFQRE
jgi:hypothetical protein